MKNNNRGFTLVELIICLSIFGILLVAVFGFMLTGAKTYTAINDRLELQVQAQLASNQVSEYIIDCSEGISFGNNTLNIINGDATAQFTFHNGILYYGPPDTTVGYQPLTENVTAFNIELFDTAGMLATPKSTLGVGSARLTLTLKLRSAVCTIEKTISLRNQPAYYVP